MTKDRTLRDTRKNMGFWCKGSNKDRLLTAKTWITHCRAREGGEEDAKGREDVKKSLTGTRVNHFTQSNKPSKKKAVHVEIWLRVKRGKIKSKWWREEQTQGNERDIVAKMCVREMVELSIEIMHIIIMVLKTCHLMIYFSREKEDLLQQRERNEPGQESADLGIAVIEIFWNL